MSGQVCVGAAGVGDGAAGVGDGAVGVGLGAVGVGLGAVGVGAGVDEQVAADTVADADVPGRQFHPDPISPVD